MIIDERGEFADATALTTGAARTALDSDVIDLGDTTNDPGNGEPVYLVILISTAVAGPDTVEFILASDAAAAIATDGSASEHFSTGAIAVATLVAGYQVCCVALPVGDYERYLGVLNTTVGAGALSAGAYNAFLTKDPHRWQAHPDGL